MTAYQIKNATSYALKAEIAGITATLNACSSSNPEALKRQLAEMKNELECRGSAA